MKSQKTTPLVLVLTGGSPIAIPELHDIADAILFVWYPGEEGGNAVADIIFGDVAPSGRLPITFPKSVDQLPPYEDYNMQGRTYKYMTEEPLYPFGFGLSFTDFQYSDLVIERTDKKKAIAKVKIKNTGQIKAEEVIQLYVSSPLAGKGDPIYDLKAFKRESFKAGEEKEVGFDLTLDQFYQFTNEGIKIVRKGNYTIHIGGSLPSNRSNQLGASHPVSKTVNAKKLIK